ncbi:MAG: hypothetical protein IKX59_00805 [Bacteroidales bacterium]|nr:hypothetical protein [Bacteroidales bacterium]
MLKKLFLSTLFLCLGILAKAEDTDVSQYENIVFPVSTTGNPGSNVTVSVEMNNTVNVVAFQFEVFLPDGISFESIVLSEERTKSGTYTISAGVPKPDGSVQVLCYSSSIPPTPFDSSSGEVCTINLNIGEGVTDGDYSITFKNIEITDTDANGHIVEEDVTATLTIGSASYDEGYSVRILPFLVTEDAEGTFFVTNATKLTNVEFDVVLPADFITNELYYIDAVLGKTKFTTSDELNGTIIHVSVARKSSNTIAIGEDTGLASLGIAYDDVIASGANIITIKNIILTDIDGNEFHAAPFTTYLIKDVYSRTMSNQWGTICLPYDTQTTDDVQLYELSRVDMTAGIMTFSPVESLSANTPAVFKTTATTATFPVVAEDEALDFVVSASTQADGWTAKGSFYDQELDPIDNESDIYYISSNKFYYANQAFAVGTFRAWFETPKNSSSQAPCFSIGIDDQSADLRFIEKSDGTVDLIYDLSGKRMQQMEQGVNIINGKKLMIK